MAIKPIKGVGVPPVTYRGTYQEALLDQTGIGEAIDDFSEVQQNQLDRLEANLEGISALQEKIFGEKFYNLRQKQQFDKVMEESGGIYEELENIDFADPYAQIELERKTAQAFQHPTVANIRREKQIIDAHIQNVLENPEVFGELRDDFLASLNQFFEDADPDDPYYAQNIDVQGYMPVDWEASAKEAAEQIQSKMFIEIDERGGIPFAKEVKTKSKDRIMDVVVDDMLSGNDAQMRQLKKRGFIAKRPDGSIEITKKGLDYAENIAKQYEIDEETYKARLGSLSSGGRGSGGDGKALRHTRDIHKSSTSQWGQSYNALDNQLMTYGVTNEDLYKDTHVIAAASKGITELGDINVVTLFTQNPHWLRGPAVAASLNEKYGMNLDEDTEFEYYGSNIHIAGEETPVTNEDGEAVSIQDIFSNDLYRRKIEEKGLQVQYVPGDKLVQNGALTKEQLVRGSNKLSEAESMLWQRIGPEETSDAVAKEHGFSSAYDAPYAYGEYVDLPEGKGLTDLTIEEVQKLQEEQIKRTKKAGIGKNKNGEIIGTGAMGKYQFVKRTLRDLVKLLGIPKDAKFSQEIQDLLYKTRLKQRGFYDYLDGKIDKNTLKSNLRDEWEGAINISDSDLESTLQSIQDDQRVWNELDLWD